MSFSSSSSASCGVSLSSSCSLDPQEELKNAFISVQETEEVLKSLTADHAPIFVAVEKRSQTCAEKLIGLLQQVDQACVTVSTCTEGLQQMMMLAAPVSSSSSSSNTNTDNMTLDTFVEKHTTRRKTLLHHSHLLEILELPSFMDACMKSHLYDEAVNIAIFANTLERRHYGSSSSSSTTMTPCTSSNTTGNPILAHVMEDIRNRTQYLYTHLLSRLQENLSLPQCLELITCLRRLNHVQIEQDMTNHTTNNNNNKKSMMIIMNTSDMYEKQNQYHEMKLQVDFLEARNVWLDSGLSTIHDEKSLRLLDEDNEYDDVFGEEEEEHKSKKENYMSTTVKRSTNTVGRMNNNNNLTILDTIEVYRTRCFEIVTEFNAIFRSSLVTTTSLEHSSSSLSLRSSDQGLLLLSSWITRRIQSFVSHTLDPHLTNVMDPSSLRDILDSVLFFALSMKRVGADFSSLLPPIFESHLVRILTHQWNEGLHQLEETLKVCREAGKASPLQDLTVELTSSEMEDDDTSYSIDPPKKILSYPPFARFVNVYLSSLNDLRRFLLVGCILPLRNFLQTEYLPKVDQVLKQNERNVMTPGFLQGKGDAAKNLRSCASGMQDMFHTCIHGYMVDALEVAFGVIKPKKSNKMEAVTEPESQNNAEAEEKEEVHIDEERILLDDHESKQD